MIALRTCLYAALGILLFIGFVMSVRPFDRRFEALFSPWMKLPGAVLVAAGVLLMLASVGIFITQGRGTPFVLDAPKEFVAAGPYRYVRNPIYIGQSAFFFGLGLWRRSISLVALALVWVVVVHLFVVYFEEPDLSRKFGATYEAYCKAVPRWVPRRGRAGLQQRRQA